MAVTNCIMVCIGRSSFTFEIARLREEVIKRTVCLEPNLASTNARFKSLSTIGSLQSNKEGKDQESI